MRRRISVAIIGLTAFALVALTLPYAVLLHRVAGREALIRLTRVAENVAAQTSTLLGEGVLPDAKRLGTLVTQYNHLVVRIPGRPTIELGPDVGNDPIRAHVRQGTISVTLTLARSGVVARSNRAVLVLVGIDLAVLAIAAVIGNRLARRIARPLQLLADGASRLGAGDFTVRAQRSGLPEIDRVAEALDRSAASISGLVEAERRFSANATHQLRSALTGLRLRLELLGDNDDPSVAEETRHAISQVDRLTDTVTELLALARTGRAGVASVFDLSDLAARHAADGTLRAAEAGRVLNVRCARTLLVHANPGAIAQAIDVLIDNALTHGRGTVTVQTNRRGPNTFLTVSDAGTGVSAERIDSVFTAEDPLADHGIGLPLARALVEADGGSLTIDRETPNRFVLRLPSVLSDRG